jgi:hypothetical protein
MYSDYFNFVSKFSRYYYDYENRLHLLTCVYRSCAKGSQCIADVRRHVELKLRRHHVTPLVRRHHVTPLVRRHHVTPLVRRHHVTPLVGRQHVTPLVHSQHVPPVAGSAC